MSETERRYELFVDPLVNKDLSAVRESDRYGFAKILVVLQELHGDLRTCECLVDEHFSDEKIESIAPFWALQDEGLNLFRIKLFDVGRWRILTAADHPSRLIAIMAVMHRDQNYEEDAALMERLRASYAKLGFRHLGRG